MKKIAASLAPFSILLLAACSPSASPSNDASASALRAAGPSAPAPHAIASVAIKSPEAPALLRDVTPGMPYAAFRKKAMAQGWMPKSDPECLTNVVGSNFKDACAKNESLCRVCSDMPELSAYSGDGQLLSYFENTADHRVLEVGGSGVLQSWNQPGHEADLQVASWFVENAGR